ncbi:MAG: LAGLIDADG family homing endonuclease [Candidatus Omnitrophica bacterium]|nr:LAGLIDADG family homing endonuclease [Candidatus Omnitrophota bacterium]
MGKSKVGIPKGQLRYFYEKKRFSIGELAKFFTCGKTTIQRSLHKYGVHVRLSMSVKIRIPKDRLNCLYVDDGKSSVQIAKMYSCTSGTILNRLKEYDIKIRDFSASHIRYPKYDFSEDLIEKSYLIGFRLGDLHVRKYEKNGKILSVECASTHLEQINLIRGLFIKYGYVRITKSDKTDIIRIQCALNPSFNFLLPKQDLIKKWILRNRKLFFAFFAGYLDAEGEINIHSGGFAYLRVGTYDKNILIQIKNELEKYGIKSKFNLDQPKGAKVNLSLRDRQRGIKKTYKTKHDFWRIAVYRKKDLLSLFKCIAPYIKHQRLKIALKKAEKNIVERNNRFDNLRMG